MVGLKYNILKYKKLSFFKWNELLLLLICCHFALNAHYGKYTDISRIVAQHTCGVKLKLLEKQN